MVRRFRNISFLLILTLLGSCAAPKVVSTWKSPEADDYSIYKVLVVGMAQEKSTRVAFETKLRDALKVKGFEAGRGSDFFNAMFTSTEKTEEDLDAVEQELLNKGFDAIILTKIIGVESRKRLRQQVGNLGSLYTQFSSDYLEHQDVMYNEGHEEFNLYTAETSLYCICTDKERALIWRGNLNVDEPVDIERTIAMYFMVFRKAMEKEEVLF